MRVIIIIILKITEYFIVYSQKRYILYIIATRKGIKGKIRERHIRLYQNGNATDYMQTERAYQEKALGTRLINPDWLLELVEHPSSCILSYGFIHFGGGGGLQSVKEAEIREAKREAPWEGENWVRGG